MTTLTSVPDVSQPSVGSYDLGSEPWIPVVGHADGVTHVSLQEALCNAHRIRAVRDPSPLVTAALHRLLIALVHRATWPQTAIGPWGENDAQAREVWLTRWREGIFPTVAVADYLNRWRDRFDLLSPTRPFFQDIRIADDRRNAPGVLALEVDAKGAKPLFYRAVEAPISPGVGACQVVALQLFALPGTVTPDPIFGNDTTQSARSGPFTRASAICMLLQGRNLFETLMLNCIGLTPGHPGPEQRRLGDVPTWERDRPADPKERSVDGYLDLLTRRTRRIRLWHEAGSDGQPMITGAAVLKGEDMPEASWWTWNNYEPMAAFKVLTEEQRKQTTQAPFRAVGFTEARALWRDSTAIVQAVGAEAPRLRTLGWLAEWLAPEDHDTGEPAGPLAHLSPIRILCLGLVNDQKLAKMWQSETLSLPSQLVRSPAAQDELRDALGAAESGGKAVREATYKLALRLVGENPDPKDVAKTTNAFDPTGRYWDELGRQLPEWLDRVAGIVLDDDGRFAVRAQWATAIWNAANRAFDSLGWSLDRSAEGLRAVALAEPTLRGALLVALQERTEGGGKSKAPVVTKGYVGTRWTPPGWQVPPAGRAGTTVSRDARGSSGLGSSAPALQPRLL